MTAHQHSSRHARPSVPWFVQAKPVARWVVICTASVLCAAVCASAAEPFSVEILPSHGQLLPSWESLEPFVLMQYLQDWQGKCLAILVTLLAFSGAWIYQSHRCQQALSRQLADRRMASHMLHDSLLQGFQGVLYRVQVARDQLRTKPDAAIAMLDAVMDRSEEALGEARLEVQRMETGFQTFNDLLPRMVALGHEYRHVSEAPDKRFQVLELGHARDMDPLARDEIYRVAREMIRSTCTDPSTTEVEVEIAYERKHFALRVRDDSSGVLAPNDHGSAGSRPSALTSALARFRAVGGRVRLWTRGGTGAELEVTLPGGVAYAHGVVGSKLPRLFGAMCA